MQTPQRLSGRLVQALAPRRRSFDRRFTADRIGGSVGLRGDEIDHYGPALVGAGSIGAYALAPELLDAVTAEVEALDPDAYTRYVASFVTASRARAGAVWRYADITTVLAAATELLRPQAYLELGVRRGRSMCVVARRAPTCDLLGVDLWNAGYAGIENPGEEHVRNVVAATGHSGTLRLISGDSHVEVPRLLEQEPTLSFDLITVDGDHSERGARADLQAVLPRLRIGGALVFDDISHPAHPTLFQIWQTATSDRRFATWVFDDVGYGVAVTVRRW